MKNEKLNSAVKTFSLFLTVFTFSFLLFHFGAAGVAHAAQGSLTVSVTPPLFQLTIGPGEFWASSLKIVNTNDYDVTYYATVVNFEPSGEAGTGSFVPLIEELGDPTLAESTLARWISIGREPVLIPKGQSREVPFEVRIPENASPGGHYAAILVGTEPPESLNDGPTVSVSSFVSSLVFVRIKGDVIEKARIREFVAEKSMYEKPEAKFVLRFENLGTVHLQPRGDITIYNAWGKERGKVLINQKTNFGNVLPQSIRRFEFDWSGEFSPLDIGPYRAIVTLAYGDSVKQNVSATTYFWVVPFVPVGITLGILILIIGGATFFIRRYVRRVLELEAGRLSESGIPRVTLENIALPLKEGAADFQSAVSQGHIPEKDIPGVPASEIVHPVVRPLSVFQFFLKYHLFFVFLVIVIASVILIVWYFGEALIPSREYTISNVSVEEELDR